jgi:hypothetical protein
MNSVGKEMTFNRFQGEIKYEKEEKAEAAALHNETGRIGRAAECVLQSVHQGENSEAKSTSHQV